MGGKRLPNIQINCRGFFYITSLFTNKEDDFWSNHPAVNKFNFADVQGKKVVRKSYVNIL